MSTDPVDPARDDLRVGPAVEEDEEGESVELEDRDIEDDPSYERFDCTGADGDEQAAAIEAARRAVEDGDCIVLPTDTVYGIGADAFSAAAVQGLLDAKGRGRDMPPPVLIGDASLVRALATDVPDQARALVEAHWPGPLTIVCRIQPSLRMDLGDTDGTIALRVPDHALARDVLRRTGPLAVSSANLSGQPAALTCDEAVEQLGDRVAVYLDGGALGVADAEGTSPVSLPSTIVDFTRHHEGEVLRRGALDLATLRRTLPGLRDLEEPEPSAPVEPETPAEPATPVEPDALVAAVEPEPEPEAPGEAVAPVEPSTHAGAHALETPADAPQPDEPRVEPEPER